MCYKIFIKCMSHDIKHVKKMQIYVRNGWIINEIKVLLSYIINLHI